MCQQTSFSQFHRCRHCVSPNLWLGSNFPSGILHPRQSAEFFFWLSQIQSLGHRVSLKLNQLLPHIRSAERLPDGSIDSVFTAMRNRGKSSVQGTCSQIFSDLNSGISCHRLSKFQIPNSKFQIPNSKFQIPIGVTYTSEQRIVFRRSFRRVILDINFIVHIPDAGRSDFRYAYRLIDLNSVPPICWWISIVWPYPQSIHLSVWEISSKNLFDSNNCRQLNYPRDVVAGSHPRQNILNTLVPKSKYEMSPRLWSKTGPPDASSCLRTYHRRAVVRTFACISPS
jgi:hypothetical protein